MHAHIHNLHEGHENDVAKEDIEDGLGQVEFGIFPLRQEKESQGDEQKVNGVKKGLEGHVGNTAGHAVGQHLFSIAGDGIIKILHGLDVGIKNLDHTHIANIFHSMSSHGLLRLHIFAHEGGFPHHLAAN